MSYERSEGGDVRLDEAALLRFSVCVLGEEGRWVCLLAAERGRGGCLSVCLLRYLCDSTAESLGQLGDLFLGCLRLLSLLIQLLRLPVVIYLQVLHTHTL